MKKIILSNEVFALVDDEDFKNFNKFNWHIDNRGSKIYAKKNCPSGKTAYLHREIMQKLNKSNLEIDHIDGNGLNNQKNNLRLATRSQNMANTSVHKDNKSNCKGVCWDKDRSKWMVRICKNYKVINIGRFKNKKEAIKAYNEKALRMFGKFALINFE